MIEMPVCPFEVYTNEIKFSTVSGWWYLESNAKYGLSFLIFFCPLSVDTVSQLIQTAQSHL